MGDLIARIPAVVIGFAPALAPGGLWVFRLNRVFDPVEFVVDAGVLWHVE
jgi:hypothetical protein